MPPSRQGPATRRLLSTENDENSSSTRTTRAKSAGLGLAEPQPPAKPVQNQKASATAVSRASQRQRFALGDVSNVGKPEAVESKRPVYGRVGLISKAAQPTGIQKNSTRATTTRSVLTSKEVQKTVINRAGSGSGAFGVHSRKESVSISTGPAKLEEETGSEKELVRDVDLVPVIEKATANASTHTATDVAETRLEKADAPLQPTRLRLPPEIEQLEQEDIGDPTMVTEYAHEIFHHLRYLETKSLPNPNYMDFQDGFNWTLRGVLIDWLLEVHTGFRLLPETLFLTVNILDRYLSLKVVPLERLQLSGLTAMLIASKYEEVMSPHVSTFVHVADKGYEEKDIFQLERHILSTLKYDLSYPNPLNFLRRVSKAENYEFQSRSLAKYLLEISLVDYRLMQYPPSQLAAAATYLSRLILDRGDWDYILVYYSGYSEEDLTAIVRLMVDYLARPVVHTFFHKKYSHKKYSKASIMTRQWAKTNAKHFGILNIHQSLDELEWEA